LKGSRTRSSKTLTQAKHDVIVADIAHYVGKNKSELRKMFGAPSKVISPSTWNDVDYDAEWVYEQGIPFVNKQYRMFYIKDDIGYCNPCGIWRNILKRILLQNPGLW